VTHDIEAYLEAATDGSDGPDAEVASLAALLRAGDAAMSADARDRFLSHPDTLMTLASAIGEDDAPRPDGVEALIRESRQHGIDSDPDHEAGDLQAYLRAMALVMPSPDWDAFAASEAARSLVDASPAGPAP
jgi:hypothetical protein